jgi:dihydroneopterin aldolase
MWGERHILDCISLHGIEFRGHHGVSSEEQTTGGHYSVDVELEADTRRAGTTDCVADTVDYGLAHRIVRRIGEEERFHLLEALAERIASALLELPGVHGVRLCVRKHRPPLPGIVAYAAVSIERRAKEADR